MSLSNILNIATSGVLAQQTAIAATSENIANVTTPDFTRREVQFQADAIAGQFSGVTVEVTRAAVDGFLQGAALTSTSDVEALNNVADALSRIVDSLGSTGDNVSFANRVDEALASLARLNANPSSPAAQAEAVATLDAAFAAFARTQGAISAERDRASTALGFDVARANDLLSEIFTLNNQIAAGGPDSNGPRDALSARLTELSGLIGISVNRDDIGRATIATGDGRILVNANGFAALTLTGGVKPQVGVTGLSANPDGGADPVTLISEEISGGSIGGALSLLNGELSALSAIVRDTEAAFAGALNAAAAGNTRFPPPTQLSSIRLPADGDVAGLSGQTTFAIVGASGSLTGRIDIDFDANTISVNNGPTTGFDPSVDGLVSVLNNAIGEAGSANVSNGVLTIESAGPGIAIADDSAGLAALFGFNAIAVETETGFGVSAALLDDPTLLAVGRLSLEGVNIGDVVSGVNDGRGAASLFEAGRTQSAAIANAIGEIGVRSNAAVGRASVAQAFSDDVNARLLAEGGVNLEQELSNLILFQRSFNANARVIAAVDELYQSVLALI